MTKWVPILDFDEQQLEIQTDCDTTFAYYGRNITSLPTSNADVNDDDQPPNESMMKNHELSLLQKMKTKMYGDSLIGRRLNNDEIEDNTTPELEIVYMMRQAGMGPSIDEGMSSKHTIPAIDSDKPHTRRGIPVLFDESYFKLRPRKRSNKSSRESPSSTDSNLSKNDSNDHHVQQPNAHRDKVSSPAVEATTMSENWKEHIDGGRRSEPTKQSARKSPLPVSRDLANTPNLLISKATNVKIRKKPKIAANFAALDAKSDDSLVLPVDSDRIRKLRNNLTFVTPAEFYRKKCQLREKSILAK